ncbi:hypothetical protein [Clostridium tyrobutyricum]|uniref:hypothetical protein n=1 Tax=Clostridium tyrobutyricum TaxID=1519 RepID=UPI00057F343A|nr:hypothetical protein [Clostridium tyrobutyricum]MBV4422111.1 hypothetical protein [Clostridium tyrobutyricum]
MSKNIQIFLRGIIIFILLICTAYLVYSIISNPLGEHDIILALAVTAGFISLGIDKRGRKRK